MGDFDSFVEPSALLVQEKAASSLGQPGDFDFGFNWVVGHCRRSLTGSLGKGQVWARGGKDPRFQAAPRESRIGSDPWNGSSSRRTLCLQPFSRMEWKAVSARANGKVLPCEYPKAREDYRRRDISRCRDRTGPGLGPSNADRGSIFCKESRHQVPRGDVEAQRPRRVKGRQVLMWLCREGIVSRPKESGGDWAGPPDPRRAYLRKIPGSNRAGPGDLEAAKGA